MNLKTLVKLSNIIATISIILLIYWVFIFVSVEVFGFKVFRENMSQTFFMSIFGILALMGGSLMINVMFNLTRIAQKHNKDEITETKSISKNFGLAFLLSFLVIFGLLYGGDYLTSKKKESILVQSARSIIKDNPEMSNKLVNYEFTENWLVETNDNLNLLSKTDENFPYVSVIVKDSIKNSEVFLVFKDYTKYTDERREPQKEDFIFATSKEERDYLQKVFDSGNTKVRFSASDGQYELYYPYFKDGKRIVLYFSDYQRYGKLGS